jgi:hypothetical protein
MTDMHYRNRRNCVIPNFSRKSTFLDWTSVYKANHSQDGENDSSLWQFLFCILYILPDEGQTSSKHVGGLLNSCLFSVTLCTLCRSWPQTYIKMHGEWRTNIRDRCHILTRYHRIFTEFSSFSIQPAQAAAACGTCMSSLQAHHVDTH